MAQRDSRRFDRESGQPQEARVRLSDLQKAVLQALRRELRRRHRPETAEGVPYPDLVRAVDADKASITSSVRQLLRKGLVLVTLPPGQWVRYVSLTKEGAEQAQLLSKDERTDRRSKRHFAPELR